MAATAGLRGQLQAQIAALEATRDPAAKGPIPIAYPQIQFDYIARASWETAIATQALYYIPASDARRFSEAYGVFACSWTRNAADLVPGRTCGASGAMPPHSHRKQRRSLVEQLRRYGNCRPVTGRCSKVHRRPPSRSPLQEFHETCH